MFIILEIQPTSYLFVSGYNLPAPCGTHINAASILVTFIHISVTSDWKNSKLSICLGSSTHLRYFVINNYMHFCTCEFIHKHTHCNSSSPGWKNCLVFQLYWDTSSSSYFCRHSYKRVCKRKQMTCTHSSLCRAPVWLKLPHLCITSISKLVLKIIFPKEIGIFSCKDCCLLSPYLAEFQNINICNGKESGVKRGAR